MTSTTGGELSRLDVRGQARVSVQRREELLAEYDRSGQSGAVFAQWAGIKYQTFAGWLHRRRRQQAQGGARFAEVTVVTACAAGVAARAPESGRLRLELPGGAWVELDGTRGAVALAAELLGELAARERRGSSC